jgi:hypothetical protein
MVYYPSDTIRQRNTLCQGEKPKTWGWSGGLAEGKSKAARFSRRIIRDAKSADKAKPKGLLLKVQRFKEREKG